MEEIDARPHALDARTVAAQLGRDVRGVWRVAVRCGWGFPQVIATEPLIDDAQPFPTLFWLTCPHIARAVSRAESAGGVSAWARRIQDDPALAARQHAADVEYRLARVREAGGADPCPGVGIAGQRDPLATKCIHAHVAAYLGGIDDPAGEAFLATVIHECVDEECVHPGEGEVRQR